MTIPLLDLKAQYRTIREEVRAAVDRVFEEQAFVLGKTVEDFEKACAGFLGVSHAIGVNSGSDALLLCLMAAGVGPGDEVLVPSFTFFATAGAVARLGAKPVFCDVDPATFCLDVEDAARRTTKKTRAVIPVHLYGQCARIEAIMDLAREHDLVVIEDAAQSFGATRNGRQSGSFAHYGCFSFYPTKNLGAAGDAGMVTSRDDALADRVRLLRTHGERPRYYHRQVGICGRLDALQAAVLHVKLKYLESWNRRRAEIAALYDRELAGARGVAIPVLDDGNTHIYHQYTVKLARRDRVMKALQEQGIGCAVYYPLSLHQQDCFKDAAGGVSLPVSEELSGTVLSLPCYPELTDQQILEVARAVAEAAG